MTAKMDEAARRRVCAGRLLLKGKRSAEVAATVGAPRQTVYRWLGVLQEEGTDPVFLTNNFPLPAATICALRKSCWQIELFFKWARQHLRIKQFIGTSENAVKSQI